MPKQNKTTSKVHEMMPPLTPEGQEKTRARKAYS